MQIRHQAVHSFIGCHKLFFPSRQRISTGQRIEIKRNLESDHKGLSCILCSPQHLRYTLLLHSLEQGRHKLVFGIECLRRTQQSTHPSFHSYPILRLLEHCYAIIEITLRQIMFYDLIKNSFMHCLIHKSFSNKFLNENKNY